MNPTNETTGLNLPTPAPEAAPVSPNTPENSQFEVEQGAGAEQSVANTQPAVPPAIIPLPTPPPIPASTADDTATVTNAVVKDDTDLIEKEWVEKAKAIVEKTRDDPYKQSEELTVVKADYMQKRYNKTIKLSK